jgi:hypothetical protein
MDNTVNRNKSDELALYLQERRYQECNYFQADRFIARCSLEWVIKGLQSRLANCLNADKGYCDIWYLESHTECKLLMDMLYEYSGNEIYNPQFIVNDPLN